MSTDVVTEEAEWEDRHEELFVSGVVDISIDDDTEFEVPVTDAEDNDTEDEDNTDVVPVQAPAPVPLPPPTHLTNAATLQNRFDTLTLTPERPLSGNHALPNNYNRPDITGRKHGAKGLQWLTGIARESLFGEKDERTAISDAASKRISHMKYLGLATDVNLRNSRGNVLSGNFFSAKGHNLKDNNGQPDTNQPVVLLLTGSGGSAEDQGLDLAEFHRSSGANVLSVNYSGYGGSEGTPSERDLVEDAQDMYEFLLKQGYTPDQITVHGFSLGGAVAAQLEKANVDNPAFRGVIADRAMTSTYDAANTGTIAPLAWMGKKAAGSFNSKEAFAGGQNIGHVVTNDEENLGPAAKKMRQDLAANQQGITGTSSFAGHMDHDAMLTRNADNIRNVVFDNNYDPNIQNTVDDLDELKRLEKEIVLAAATIDDIDSQAKQQQERPVRNQLQALQDKVDDLETLFSAVDQSNLFDQIVTETMVDSGDSTQRLMSLKELYRQVKQNLRITKMILTSARRDLDNGTKQEWTPPDDNQIQQSIAADETSITQDVTQRFTEAEISRIESATSKKFSNEFTKRFRTAVKRMKQLRAAIAGGNLTAQQMVDQLTGIENAANFARMGLIDKYGDAQRIKGSTNRNIYDEANNLTNFVREQRLRYDRVVIFEDLRTRGVDRVLSDRVLKVLQDSADQGVAQHYLVEHQNWLLTRNQDPIGVAVMAKHGIDDKLDELRSLQARIAAALKGGTKKGQFWFFARMIDGTPLFVPDAALVTDASRCCESGVNPSSGSFKKWTSLGRKKFSYTAGPTSEADMLKGLIATGWNVAELAPGSTLNRVPRIR